MSYFIYHAANKWEVGSQVTGTFVTLRSFDRQDQAESFLNYLNGGLADERKVVQALEHVAIRLETVARFLR